ncbi:putative membrane protein [Deinobacterium chartae]|uniref:Putative membrane protein n=1 Tax=Deinobacterium chartae TaxID=521158 RepID=A0A841HUS2_9DEIO|nr:DUF1648 domain-containing protein [Deinobacterium chartae]MBB6097107.1 putative membrane protein [Deinobacterium chartae]
MTTPSLKNSGFLSREWPALLILAFAFAVALWAWPNTPERIPVHWGLDGQPDRYGSRFEGLLALPVIAGVIYVAVLLLERKEAARVRGVGSALYSVRLGVVLMLCLISVSGPLGWSMMRSAVIGAGLLFMLIGNVMGKVGPNRHTGPRLVWTFASDRAWYATSRRGAVLLVLSGALILLAGLLLPQAALIPWVLPLGMIVLLLAQAVYLNRYARQVWSEDPERRPVSRPS